MKAQYLAVILIFTALLGVNSQSTAPGTKIGIVEELRAILIHLVPLPEDDVALHRQRRRQEKARDNSTAKALAMRCSERLPAAR